MAACSLCHYAGKPAAEQTVTLWLVWRMAPGSTNSFLPDISETRNYLQTLGLLGETLEHDKVARFLRHCPGLSKQTIGDLLGENDQFFLDVLDAFTGTFSFRGAHPCTMIVFWASMLLTHGACKPVFVPCLQRTAVWSKTQDKAMLTSSQRSDPSV